MPRNKITKQKKTTMLKVLCASPEAVNLFITGCIHIEDHLVNACKIFVSQLGVLNARNMATHVMPACV